MKRLIVFLAFGIVTSLGGWIDFTSRPSTKPALRWEGCYAERINGFGASRTAGDPAGAAAVLLGHSEYMGVRAVEKTPSRVIYRQVDATGKVLKEVNVANIAGNWIVESSVLSVPCGQ